VVSVLGVVITWKRGRSPASRWRGFDPEQTHEARSLLGGGGEFQAPSWKPLMHFKEPVENLYIELLFAGAGGGPPKAGYGTGWVLEATPVHHEDDGAL
jgi:hypothetical protein